MLHTPWFGSHEPGTLPYTEALSSLQHINSSVTLPQSVKKSSLALPSVRRGRADGAELGAWRRRATPGRVTAGVVAALLVLVVLGLPSVRPVAANTGCPESTSSFGAQTFVGTCTVTSGTTWENGVLTIAGDVVVNAPLTLRNLVIAFDPSFDGEYEFVISASLDMQGGGIQSTNSNQWLLSIYKRACRLWNMLFTMLVFKG